MRAAGLVGWEKSMRACGLWPSSFTSLLIRSSFPLLLDELQAGWLHRRERDRAPAGERPLPLVDGEDLNVVLVAEGGEEVPEGRRGGKKNSWL